MKLLIYILGIIGSTGSLIYSFNFNTSPHLIFVFCIMVGLFIYFGYMNIKNKNKFIVGGLIFEGGLLILPKTITCFSYLVSVVVHKYREVSVYQLSYQSMVNYFDDPFACICAFLLLFIPMYILALIAIDKNKHFLAIFALLPGVFIELLFTITPPWYYIGSFLLYFLVLFINGLQKGNKIKIAVIGLCLFSMTFTYLVFSPHTYQVSPINLFNNAKTPLTTAGGSFKKEYDIKEQGNRYYRNSIDFVVEGASELTNFKIRGIGYDQYDNGKWSIVDDERTYIDWVYRNLDIINKVTKVSIQNIRIEQLSGYTYRNYAPYYFSNDNLTYYNNYFMGENPETYEMIVPNNDFNELLSSVDASVKKEKLQEIAARNGTLEDIKNMQTYRYQNKDILTAVSDEDAKIIDQFLLENNIVYNGDVYNLIDQCKNALANQTTYTLKPGDLPSGVNYLDYFLNVHKQGYCVHYASALALMLRRNGIAARFVLGYQADGSKDADGKLIIRDRNEHAWVEIFDDYLGWIPIEAIGAGVISQDDETSPITDNNQNNNQTTPILPNQTQEEISTETESTIVIPFYVYFLGLFIAGLVVIVLQAVIRRKRRFKDAKNNNQLVCFYCHYLSKLNGDLSGIKKIGDKARFSLHEITDEELEFVANYYFKQLKIIYKKANIFKKVYIKFILAYL